MSVAKSLRWTNQLGGGGILPHRMVRHPKHGQHPTQSKGGANGTRALLGRNLANADLQLLAAQCAQACFELHADHFAVVLCLGFFVI